MKTYSPKPQDIERRWYVIDATGAVLGRLSSEVAAILRGKHKPIFAPHADTGDHVIVINARGIVLTGGKEAKKFAYRHSGYPGGLTATQYTKLLSDRPEFAVEKAIRGMLPKNRLGRAMAKKLQVYPGAEHPHVAQQPQPLKLGEIPPWTGLPEPKVKEPKVKGEDKPEPTAAAKKRSTAKRPAAKPAAKATTAKPAAKATTAKKITAKKPTVKTSVAKKATTAKATTAKATTAKKTSVAKKLTARRPKKEA